MSIETQASDSHKPADKEDWRRLAGIDLVGWQRDLNEALLANLKASGAHPEMVAGLAHDLDGLLTQAQAVHDRAVHESGTEQ